MQWGLFAAFSIFAGLSACTTTPPTVSPPDTENALLRAEPVAAGELRRPMTYALLGVIVPEGRAPEAVSRKAVNSGLTIARSMYDTLAGAVLIELVSPATAMYKPELLDAMSRGIDEAGLAASARARGGARPVVLLATWEAASPEGSVDPGAEPPPPRIRLEVPRGEAASHEEAFVIALARVFGDADERLA